MTIMQNTTQVLLIKQQEVQLPELITTREPTLYSL